MDSGAKVRFRLGVYTCVEKLGQGPLGESFRAKLYGPGGQERLFGVKRLAPCWAEDAARMAHLAELMPRLQRLRCAGLVPVHELGVDGGERFVVTDYAHGVTLGKLVDQLRAAGERLSPDEGAMAVAEMATAVAYAHDRGEAMGGPLCHGALSPEAGLLCDDGEIRLLDLGLWLIAEPFDRRQPPFVELEPFTAPEVLEVGVTGPPADVYALGALLGWAVGGHSAPATSSPSGDPRLEELIQRCLAAPAARPSARQVADELRAWLGQRAPRARGELQRLGRRLVTRPRTTGVFQVSEIFGAGGLPSLPQIEQQLGLPPSAASTERSKSSPAPAPPIRPAVSTPRGPPPPPRKITAKMQHVAEPPPEVPSEDQVDDGWRAWLREAAALPATPQRLAREASGPTTGVPRPAPPLVTAPVRDEDVLAEEGAATVVDGPSALLGPSSTPSTAQDVELSDGDPVAVTPAVPPRPSPSPTVASPATPAPIAEPAATAPPPAAPPPSSLAAPPSSSPGATAPLSPASTAPSSPASTAPSSPTSTAKGPPSSPGAIKAPSSTREGPRRPTPLSMRVARPVTQPREVLRGPPVPSSPPSSLLPGILFALAALAALGATALVFWPRPRSVAVITLGADGAMTAPEAVTTPLPGPPSGPPVGPDPSPAPAVVAAPPLVDAAPPAPLAMEAPAPPAAIPPSRPAVVVAPRPPVHPPAAVAKTPPAVSPRDPASNAGRAAVDFRSEPSGAALFVDGQPSGVTPLRLELDPGAHRIVLSLAGRELHRRSVVVPRGPSKHLARLASVSLPGRVGTGVPVEVQCRTAGELRIFVDRFDSGVTCPTASPLQMGPGRHRIAVFSPRTGKSVQVERELEAGQPERVFISY